LPPHSWPSRRSATGSGVALATCLHTLTRLRTPAAVHDHHALTSITYLSVPRWLQTFSWAGGSGNRCVCQQKLDGEFIGPSSP
jgi:hypothetical protein